MMRALHRLIQSIRYRLLLSFILLTSFLLFLLTTTEGLYLISKGVSLVYPIQFKGAAGRLIDHISFQSIQFKHPDVEVSLKNVHIQWRLSHLLFKQLPVNEVHIERLDIVHDNQHPTQINIDLPFFLSVSLGKVDHFRFKEGNTPIVLDDISLQGTMIHHDITLKQFQAKSTHTLFDLTGFIHARLPLNVNANLALTPIDNDGLKGNLTLSGKDHKAHWQLQILSPYQVFLTGHQNNDFFYTHAKGSKIKLPFSIFDKLQFNQSDVKLEGHWPKLQLSAKSEIDGLIHGQWQLNANGTPFQFSATSYLNMLQGQLKATVNVNPNALTPITGMLKSDNLNLETFSDSLKTLTFALSFSGKSFQLLQGAGDMALRYFDNNIHTHVTFAPNAYHINTSLGNNTLTIDKKTHWSGAILIKDFEKLNPQWQGLKTTFRGQLSDNKKGIRLNCKLSPGSFTPSDSKQTLINFHGGEIITTFQSDKSVTSGQLTLDQHKTLNLKLALNNYKTIEGELTLAVNNLDFLQNLTPNIDKPQGALSARLIAKGPLFAPSLSGNLDLNHGQVILPHLGLTLSPINLHINSVYNHWLAQGNVSINQRPITITGDGEGLLGKFHLSGSDIPAIHTSEYQLNATPNLLLTFNHRKINLTGSIDIPTGLIKPNHFSNTIDLTDDAVIVDDTKETPLFNITTHLMLKVGQNVILLVKGLKTHLQGELQLSKTSTTPLAATGALSMVKGHYQAYGQHLKVNSGQLIFNHNPIDNPTLRLRATKKLNAKAKLEASGEIFDFNPQNLTDINYATNTNVGIEVSGHLNNPKITLFSIPTQLSQADILSLLILGKPASQASQSGGQLLMAAIAGMNLDSGSEGIQLIQQFKNLGFNFNVANNPNTKLTTGSTQEQTAFVVGKALSRRLYLSYNVGLTQANTNVLTLQYLLNQFFSIQLTASQTGNGIDVLYTTKK